MEKKFLDKFFFIFFNLNELNALLVQVWSLATSFFVGGSRRQTRSQPPAKAQVWSYYKIMLLVHLIL